jgi:hypothetical protein
LQGGVRGRKAVHFMDEHQGRHIFWFKVQCGLCLLPGFLTASELAQNNRLLQS